jgi:hypothetical protein
MTTKYYDYYLEQKARIIAKMNETDAILDVADNYTREEFVDMGNLLKGEYRDYTDRQIAKKLAEDQTYFITSRQAETTITAIENYWKEMGIDADEREVLAYEDFIYGTRQGRALYDKYYKAISDYYKALKEAGMSGTDAGKTISQVIFGSD